jgi:hypothetical protein
MSKLPTVDEMFGHALDELNKARTAMSEARDWVKSDTRPLGAGRTPMQRRATEQVLEAVGQVKALIDEAKGAIWQALDSAQVAATPDRDEDTDGVT